MHAMNKIKIKNSNSKLMSVSNALEEIANYCKLFSMSFLFIGIWNIVFDFITV